MTIFSWIMFALTSVLAAGTVLSFVLFMAFDINVWLDRARSLRRATYMAVLLWFNVWVWGRVIITIIRW